MATDVLKIVNRLGWDYGIGREGAAIYAPNQQEADKFLDEAVEQLQEAATHLQGKIKIAWEGCRRPYTISASMNEQPSKQEMVEGNIKLLLGANHLQIQMSEFLTEQYRAGKIVILTGHRSNICQYTSDLLKPSRAFWSASQFDGYDYLISWRNTGSLQKYDRLIAALDKDGFAPKYDYELVRPDGALCGYQTDYYKARNSAGEEIRIGVSDPGAWALLEPAKA